MHLQNITNREKSKHNLQWTQLQNTVVVPFSYSTLLVQCMFVIVLTGWYGGGKSVLSLVPCVVVCSNLAPNFSLMGQLRQ